MSLSCRAWRIRDIGGSAGTTGNCGAAGAAPGGERENGGAAGAAQVGNRNNAASQVEVGHFRTALDGQKTSVALKTVCALNVAEIWARSLPAFHRPRGGQGEATACASRAGNTHSVDALRTRVPALCPGVSPACRCRAHAGSGAPVVHTCIAMPIRERR
eukprot:gene13630-biopygen20053